MEGVEISELLLQSSKEKLPNKIRNMYTARSAKSTLETGPRRTSRRLHTRAHDGYEKAVEQVVRDGKPEPQKSVQPLLW